MDDGPVKHRVLYNYFRSIVHTERFRLVYHELWNIFQSIAVIPTKNTQRFPFCSFILMYCNILKGKSRVKAVLCL